MYKLLYVLLVLYNINDDTVAHLMNVQLHMHVFMHTRAILSYDFVMHVSLCYAHVGATKGFYINSFVDCFNTTFLIQSIS